MFSDMGSQPASSPIGFVTAGIWTLIWSVSSMNLLMILLMILSQEYLATHLAFEGSVPGLLH